MKKRTLPLLMLLAGLSVAALAACDDHEHAYMWKNSEDGTTHWQECECGDKINEGLHVDEDANGKCDVCEAHVHHYVWNSDAAKHWQECACGDKKEEGAHVDIKNNETGIGFSDGKCDDCGREVTVRFAMKGHGTAPASQYVALGEKATAPETPADEDAFKFKGWYKDAACTDGQEFDFTTETINEVTTIFAKWEEDTTEGASKAHAFELSMTTEDNLKSVKNGETLFFKFTAELEGRYTIVLGDGQYSRQCSFTTSLTGDKVYSYDADNPSASSVSFDMDAEQEMYVSLTYHGADSEDETPKAGLVLSEALGEDLPEDYFLDGEYSNANGSITLVLDRTKDTITYNDISYPIKYIGGKFDRIHFDMTMGTRIYLSHNADGSYGFSDSMGYMPSATVNRFVAPETLIDFGNLVGYYEPQGDVGDGITELYIFASEAADDPESDTVLTNVLYQQNGYYNSESATYYKTKNRLVWGSTAVTLNLDGKNVASIQIGSNAYTCKRTNLGTYASEIPLTDGSPEYYGANYAIRSTGYSLFFGATGNDGITVTEVVEGKYKIAAKVGNEFKKYQLAVSNDKKTITLYGEDGTNLIDTLTLLEFISHELPASSQTISLQASDFQKGSVGTVCLYQVKTAGWYQFTDVPKDVEIYYDLTQFDNNAKDNGILLKSEAVKLAENSYVCVFIEEAAATEFSVAPSNPADGWEGGTAKVLVDDIATLNDVVNGETYSFKYTAPENGNYQLYVYYNQGLGSYESISFSVNGKSESVYDYGKNNNRKFVVITATDETKVFDISLTASIYSTKSLTVSVVEDYTTGAKDVTLEGEPEGDSVTLSATATSGSNYKFTSTNEKAVTATADAAFTVKTQNGKVLTATENGGKFTVTISADTDYFTIVSDTQQDVTLSQTFEKGSKVYPLSATVTGNTATITVEQTNTVFFTLPAGAYKFSATESVSIYKVEEDEEKNDTRINENTVFAVAEGDVFYCSYYNGEGLSVTLTIEKLTAIFTEEQVSNFEGMTVLNEIPVALAIKDLYGTVTYTVGKNSYNVVAIKDGETFAFVYGRDGSIRVRFTFGKDGTLQVLDDSLDSGSAFSLEKKALPATYSCIDNGITYSLTVNADFTEGTYVTDDPYDTIYTYEVTITKSGNEYTFDYGEGWMASTVTFTVEGDTMELTDYFGTLTLTKQA